MLAWWEWMFAAAVLGMVIALRWAIVDLFLDRIGGRAARDRRRERLAPHER